MGKMSSSASGRARLYGGLDDVEAAEAVRCARFEGLGKLLAGEVATPDGARPSGGDLLGHGGKGLGDGGVVGIVELVHVDAVDAESFEACGEGHPDVLRIVAGADLGAEGDLVAAAAGAQPASDDPLGRAHFEAGLANVVGAVEGLTPGVGLAAAVDLAGIEEGDAVLDGVVHDAPRGVLVDLAAPVAGAESKGGDGNVGASELAGFHATSPLGDYGRAFASRIAWSI